jgi:hypothetical protein
MKKGLAAILQLQTRKILQKTDKTLKQKFCQRNMVSSATSKRSNFPETVELMRMVIPNFDLHLILIKLLANEAVHENAQRH